MQGFSTNFAHVNLDEFSFLTRHVITVIAIGEHFNRRVQLMSGVIIDVIIFLQ